MRQRKSTNILYRLTVIIKAVRKQVKREWIGWERCVWEREQETALTCHQFLLSSWLPKRDCLLLSDSQSLPFPCHSYIWLSPPCEVFLPLTASQLVPLTPPSSTVYYSKSMLRMLNSVTVNGQIGSRSRDSENKRIFTFCKAISLHRFNCW